MTSSKPTNKPRHVSFYQQYIKETAERAGLHNWISAQYDKSRKIKNMFIGKLSSLIIKALFHISNSKSVTHNIAGTSVELPLNTEWQYRRFRWMHAEEELFYDIHKEHESGDVFYDVGTYFGWHSIVAAQLIQDGEVIGFEPHPTTFNRFEQVISWTGDDVTAYNVALYDTEGTIEFTAEPQSSARIAGSRGSPHDELIQVRTVPGDDLINRDGLKTPDILKIDAEGAEREVLEGLKSTIEETAPRVIYCEVHESNTGVTDLLTSFGYSVRDFETGRPLVKATF